MMGSMTSVLPPRPPSRPAHGGAGGGAGDAVEESTDVRHRRPLALVAGIGGAGAALATVAVICAVTVVGWFLTDSGNFGEPRDAVRIGSVLWLIGQGAGVHITGTAVTMVPLGVTFLVGWGLWRGGLKVGDSISGHGPDADRIADGERDWTVPGAVALFALSYAVAVAVIGAVTTSPELGLGVAGATVTGFALAVVCGGAGIAVGSGRATIWVLMAPQTLRLAAVAIWRIFRTWMLVCLALVVITVALDFSTAANVMSQLGTSGPQSLVYSLATVAVIPNALAFGGAFLLGPGFLVGTGTVVAPSGVALGPLPMFPLFAALPEQGPQPAWTGFAIVLAGAAAALVVVRLQRAFPTTRWEEGLIRGLAGGVGAGLLFGLLMHWSGGGIGPGRMAEVGPHVMDATVRAVVAMGLGGVLAGLVMTALQRRSAATR